MAVPLRPFSPPLPEHIQNIAAIENAFGPQAIDFSLDGLEFTDCGCGLDGPLQAEALFADSDTSIVDRASGLLDDQGCGPQVSVFVVRLRHIRADRSGQQWELCGGHGPLRLQNGSRF